MCISGHKQKPCAFMIRNTVELKKKKNVEHDTTICVAVLRPTSRRFTSTRVCMTIGMVAVVVVVGVMINPYRTAVPFWARTTQILYLSSFVPETALPYHKGSFKVTGFGRELPIRTATSDYQPNFGFKSHAFTIPCASLGALHERRPRPLPRRAARGAHTLKASWLSLSPYRRHVSTVG